MLRLDALPKLLDELTPDWREETDDPLAAVRGIADEAKKAWAQANADVIDRRSMEIQRDELRAKLAEAERERDEARRERSDVLDRNEGLRVGIAAAESALAGERERAEDARKIALEEASRIWNAIAGDRVRTGVTRIEDEIVAKAYREVAADLMDRSRRRATTGGENIQRGGSVNAAESQHGSGHREQVRASQAEELRGRGQDRSVAEDLRGHGGETRGAVAAGTGSGGRAHALGDGELLGERGDCSRVGSGGTVRGVTDHGAAPSPAAPDFELRVKAVKDYAYISDGSLGVWDVNKLARRCVTAEDEAKRLRDMIAEYVAAKSAGTSGPTSPSAVRPYRAERALKDADRQEEGR